MNNEFIMSEDVIQDVCKLLNIENQAVQRLDVGIEIGKPVVISMEYIPRKKKRTRRRKQPQIGFRTGDNQ
jgi:hypothetical protein